MLIAVSVLAWIFAPWIVKNGLYALTADSNIGQLDVTVRLLRIMLPTVVIFGMSGLVMGMLNAHRSFLIPCSCACYVFSGNNLWHRCASEKLGR